MMILAFVFVPPNLVSLLLDRNWGKIPLLESMPSLVKAFVAVEAFWDSCDLRTCNCEFCDNSYSISDGTRGKCCVLLKGLSEAKHLALSCEPQTVCLQFHLYLNYIMPFHYLLN